jgi:glycerophosphoryl diester phosphodiesterase
MLNFNKIKNFSPPWIIGHRGYSQKYPENTLAAFQAAVSAGVPMIELDVMFSRDRKPVVIHDDTLERTTNGHGEVKNFTVAELQKLDAGSWFDSKFADQRLPELSEVLDLVGGRANVNIEIKTQAYEHAHPPDAIEKQVVAIVKKKNLKDSVLISSFEIEFLVQIASLPDPPAIALLSSTPASPRIVDICTHLSAFSWHPDLRVVTPDQVDRMHHAGIKVFPYTVNTCRDHDKMIAMNVDGVITDDPLLAGQCSRIRTAA